MTDKKKLGLLALLSGLNVLCMGCLQNEPLDPETYPLMEPEIRQSQPRIVSSETTRETEPTSRVLPSEPRNSSYRNEEFGISFPYPEGVHVQVHESAVSIWTADDYEQIEEFIEVTPLLIEVKDNPSNLRDWEWFLTQSYNLTGEGEVEEQMVGDQYGIVFKWLGMWSFTSVAVPHPTRPKMIVITWDNGISAYQELFYDTLAGLEFI